MKTIIFISTILITSNLFAQNNLVPNNSFEFYSICPNNGVGQINRGLPWFQPNNPLVAPGGSSDYFHTCNFPNPLNVPYNFSYQFPRTGNGYAGIAMFFDSTWFNIDIWREYLEVELTDSLDSGKNYCVKFYTVKGNWSSYAVKNIQAVLTKDSLLYNDPNYGYMGWVSPVAEANTIITDTLNWVAVQNVYTALGGEKFITIGNFSSGAQTQYQYVWPFNGSPNTLGYYLIDDASVYEQPEINAGLDSTIYLNDTIFNLGPQNVRPDVFYSWSPAAGLSNPNSPNPIAFPTQTTTYTLTITDTSQWACSPTLTDQITITVIDTSFNPDEINLFVPTAFSPNGDNNNDILFVRARYPIEQLEFKVFDRWGTEVFSTTNPLEGWNGKYKNKELNSAVFFYYAKVVIRGREYTSKGNVTLVK